mmetsp:Transcript_7668/g.9494  ORF Transcript_7668/g.9494 Transcript_7668/m.9494 type:complete len:221 (-) Transcript_7668:126-788(-)
MFSRVTNKHCCRGLTFRRFYVNGSSPPLHFGNPNYIPPPYNETLSPPQAINAGNTPPNSQVPPSFHESATGNHRSLKDFTSFIAMCALAYFAIDNYMNRIKLEKLNIETTAINLKTLQAQQANFLNARKKRDLQILQERKDQDKRNFKMGLHIAFLRKQLVDLGVDPVDIETAIKEFERSVRADNSIKNVSGQSLWLDDKSRMYPSIHSSTKTAFHTNIF